MAFAAASLYLILPLVIVLVGQVEGLEIIRKKVKKSENDLITRKFNV